jgi:hypothetical protein
VSFAPEDDLYAKLRHLQRVLTGLFDSPKCLTHIFIEEPKKMFGKRSSAHVMSLLQRWNGMVSAMISLEFLDPVLVNEKSARKAVGVHVPKDCKNAKLLVAEHLYASSVLPSSVWEHKRTGKLKDHCLDIADAYVVARAGYLSAAAPIS